MTEQARRDAHLRVLADALGVSVETLHAWGKTPPTSLLPALQHRRKLELDRRWRRRHVRTMRHAYSAA